MRKTILILSLAASALGATACSAQATQTNQTNQADTAEHGHGHRGAMMMRADTNRDGVITRAEAIAAADARLDKLDTNHDGTVTADEMAARRAAMRERMAARGMTLPDGATRGMGRHRDRDGDGIMTKAEAEAHAATRFDRMDANHDGKLDKTELANLREMRHLRHDKMRGGDMPPPQPTDNQ
ncbi:hypothetical protein [Sphingomonas oligophenolica]|nr:hypothetical protein [Sphingomonas oligophenolica]